MEKYRKKGDKTEAIFEVSGGDRKGYFTLQIVGIGKTKAEAYYNLLNQTKMLKNGIYQSTYEAN